MPSALDNPVTGGAPNLLGSLTAAARRLPEDADWMAYGVSHVPENCGSEWVWQACTVGDKPLNEGVAAVTFHPFLIEFNAASCEGGIPSRELSQLEKRATRGLALRLTRGIAHAISSSEPDGSPNESPNLPELAIDATPGGGPGNLACSIAGLLEDAEACGLTGEAFIHAPGWMLPHFLAAQLITQVGNVYKMGPHTVVLDQGYSNEAPTGGAAAAPGQAWIYVTGPIEYATGPVRPLGDTTGYLQTRLNAANAIAAANAIYRFDPCCVYAALVQACE